MDGFGMRDSDDYNAIKAARKPNFDYYWNKYPHTTLGASGLSVGLPEGQMGNSEVGHLNFGAGRIVYQEVTRIDKAIKDGDFFKNPALNKAIERTIETGKSLHLLGLLSDGCVHSSEKHLYALLRLCAAKNLKNVYVHAFLDGRDTSPYSGVQYVERLNGKIAEIGIGKIATIIGRYYAMDRDKRWPRTKQAYDLMCAGKGEMTDDFIVAIKEHYKRENTDEFMEPLAIKDIAPGKGLITEGDNVIFFNFRADRTRQISRALTEESFADFERNPKSIVNLTTLTLYDVDLKAEVAFPQVRLDNIFPEVISRAGLKQLRIAETEKYPHVTFFFNGGVERTLEGEDRVLIPSPKVATYDLQPEMSAPQVTSETLRRINSDLYDVIILNYANCDMVGHTGVYEAAIKAVEAVDCGIGQVIKAILARGGVVLLTADHGNAEIMREADGTPFTAHSTSPVPLVIIDDIYKGGLRDDGVLADIAPTMLRYLGIPQPAEMTGRCMFLE
jgi:2,3-bisphosphoglycerate-independent phosphoglycerate mutase